MRLFLAISIICSSAMSCPVNNYNDSQSICRPCSSVACPADTVMKPCNATADSTCMYAPLPVIFLASTTVADFEQPMSVVQLAILSFLGAVVMAVTVAILVIDSYGGFKTRVY